MKTILSILFTVLLFYTATAQISSFKINPSNSIQALSVETTESVNLNGKNKNVYKTIEIIEYNYYSKEKENKKKLLTKITDELYIDSKASTSNKFDKAKIKAKADSIKILETEISKIENTQDSLYMIYTKEFMATKNVNFLNFGVKKSQAFFDVVHGNTGKTFRALGNTGLNFGNETASLYSEIVSANLGVMRVSLGAMIAKSSNKDSIAVKNNEAYQRLISNGGNTVLNFEYPLIYIHSKNNKYNFITTFNTKGTADIPAFGTSTSKWAGSGSFGLNLYGEATTNKNEISFFANFNMNMYFGTNTFRDNLGILNNNFTFGQLSAGLIFLQNFKISFIIATLTSEGNLRNRSVTVGGQVIR
ncbi:hypothetical protein JI747_017540 [Chryseobacterium sp. RG1]|uniref:Uncharacterized protein n=1 Tax=Chryseobacterium tagetis TaxID=2801334 RepID=A0ABS8A664_9FLAO|nr:hypothetical protein [Chryseobacterium tagetis]MCA6068973.1 hypothetical protein [Chryseobacterium tagetis]